MPKNKIFSFFSGAGFLDLGFENSGFEVVFVNEYCSHFLNAYKHSRKKLGAPAPRFGHSGIDINKFLSDEKFSKILTNYVSLAKEDKGLVGFIGGPPCPDFSLGGKHRGFEGENGKLTRVYIDLVLKQKPDWFLFENVKGLFYTKKHRDFFDKILKDLKKAGYAINYDILNALEFGVPQYRERVILVGIKKSLIGNDYLSAPSKDETYSQYREMKSLNFRAHAKHSLKDVLNLKWPKKNKFKDPNLEKPKNVLIKLTVGHWLNKNLVDQHPNAQDFFSPTKGNRKFSKIKEGCDSGKSYKRLHRWRYSPTAAYGNNEVHLHPFEPRRISAAEALAIQSMPADYELPPNMALSYMFKTIGNGVPFLMAGGIAKSIASYLKNPTLKETKRKAIR